MLILLLLLHSGPKYVYNLSEKMHFIKLSTYLIGMGYGAIMYDYKAKNQSMRILSEGGIRNYMCPQIRQKTYNGLYVLGVVLNQN